MEFESRGASLVRRNVLAIVGAAVPFALGLAMLLFGLLTSTAGAAAMGASLAWVGYFVTFFTVSRQVAPLVRKVCLRAGPAGLFVDDALVAARDDVTRAYLQPAERGQPPMVRVEHTHGGSRHRLDLRVRDEAEGRALLDALGRGVAQAAATWRVRVAKDVRAASLLWLFVGLVAAFGTAASLLEVFGLGVVTAPAIFAAAIWFVHRARALAVLTVGADGVSVRDGGSQRFVSYADVESVEHQDTDVRIEVRNGAPLVVQLVQKYDKGATGPEVLALVARVKEALDAFHARAPREDAGALIAKSPRATKEWLLTLRAVAHGGVDAYRSVAIAPEVLWSLVEDPSVDSAARAGAAVMLRGALDDGGRARLRLAAGACASPRLRVALDAVAVGGDEAEIAAALEAEEEDPDAAASRRSQLHP